MSNPLRIKGSSVSGKIPLPQDLVARELALNFQDGLLFYRTPAGEIAILLGDHLRTSGDQELNGDLECHAISTSELALPPEIEGYVDVMGDTRLSDVDFQEATLGLVLPAEGAWSKIGVTDDGALTTEDYPRPLAFQGRPLLLDSNTLAR
jgi:hypothetical protein